MALRIKQRFKYIDLPKSMNKLEHQPLYLREMSELARKREKWINSIRSAAKSNKLTCLRNEAIISMNINSLLSNLFESYEKMVAVITQKKEMSTPIALRLWEILRNQQHSFFEFKKLPNFRQILIISFLLKALSNHAAEIFSLLYTDLLESNCIDSCSECFMPLIIMLKYSQTNILKEAVFLMKRVLT